MEAIINDDRYMIYEQLQPLADGILYSGRDISLQRDVFLFVVKKDKATHDTFMQTLSKVSGFSNSRFFHILNAGKTTDAYYAVLTAWTGTPLSLNASKHTLSPQEIISEVLALGTSIMDALEAGITGINVTAENLWLTKDKKLYVLDIWTKSSGELSNVKGLSRLIYQLGVYSDDVPVEWEQKPVIPLPAFSEWNEASALSLMNLAWLGFHGEHTLSSFMLELHTILEQSGMVVPSLTQKVVKAKQRIEQNTIDDDTSYAENAALDDEQRKQEDELKAGASPGKTLNRLTVVFTFVVVAILAVAMLWSNLSDRSAENQLVAEETPPTDVERGELQYEQPNTNEPDPVDDVSEDPVDDEADSGELQSSGSVGSLLNSGNVENPDSDSDESGSEPELVVQGESIETPSFLGMALEEAEKHAFDNGLRWAYFFINNDEETGKVFMQQPEPGEPIVVGERVTIWVSR